MTFNPSTTTTKTNRSISRSIPSTTLNTTRSIPSISFSLFVFLLFLVPFISMVKQEDFKTCAQSSFCSRQNAYAESILTSESTSPYSILSSTIRLEKNELTFNVINSVSSPSQTFLTTIEFIQHQTIRFKFIEIDQIKIRYNDVSQYSIIGDQLPIDDITVQTNASGSTFNYNHLSLTIQYTPFKFDIKTKNGDPVFQFNHNDYFNYEHYIPQQQFNMTNDDSSDQSETLEKNLESNMFEETWKSFTDSKPKGPESIGIDFTFPGFQHTYGLAEHASSLTLKPTRGEGRVYTEPYRLYNLDVFEYELDSPMAIYGSVPYILAHKKSVSAGILWVNAAEMWVDIENTKESTSVHWKTESSVLDLFITVADTPHELAHVFANLTGKPAMPPLFSIAYHQCRWNYNDEQDVLEVNDAFDVHDISYDVLWLDIEHTDNKKYFTWDSIKFSDPKKMLNTLESTGRKMVTIADPHIKTDDTFYVSSGASERSLFVKGVDGHDYSGWCWPGNSNWLDYTNPAAREYWASLFELSSYKNSTMSLFTWNDMNEPSVFSGPEITMLKDNLHYGNVEHRDVHNLYGMLQHRATYEGHLKRSQGKQRPFVLSRAFFIGTQRYGPVWTGDNFARWDHMVASIPMILSLSVSGIPFSGADVGGFFGNPDAELLIRWYQLGAFQPFFRAHAHIDTKRREPWLFGKENTDLIRSAIQQRYRNLPYLYTLNFEASQTGMPIMRPLFYEFPNNVGTFGIGDQFMLGSAFMVKAVSEPGQSFVTMYIPSESLWYDYSNYEQVKGDTHSLVDIPTPLDKLPVLIRGGSIIVRKERVRRSSLLQKHDPYTLLITLDSKGSAHGRLYVDDGESFDFEEGKYILNELEFQNGILTSYNRNSDAQFVRLIERIVIVSSQLTKQKYTRVSSHAQNQDTLHGLEQKMDHISSRDTAKGGQIIVIKKPFVKVGEDWSLVLE